MSPRFNRPTERKSGEGRGGGRFANRGAQRGRGRRFAELKIHEIDYRNERLLRKFISERGKILPRRITGVSALFQRRVTRAVKRARHLALLPFVAETYK